jgi:class 3 adenylate cyclase
MMNSTKLSAEAHDNSTAGAYQLFTGTAVKLFNEFEAPYIDVRGDGIFALFNEYQSYRAIAAAITFKTFANEVCIPKIIEDTGVKIGSHIGIDQKTVLVRKLGFKRYGGRTDRQNEVWAGKTVNMASKLASLTIDNELLVSDRFFKNIQHDLTTWSCGCPENRKVYLWELRDLASDDKFDFDNAHSLKSIWCVNHGREYCEKILALDDET